MKPEDVRKLVGGHAMGVLTEQERRTLLEAALWDQDLFDELALEQPLKDLLEDPLARRELLNAVEATRAAAAGYTAWWKRPATWALAGGLATAAMLVAIFVRPPGTSPKPETVLMAKREAAPMATPVVSAPQPAREAPARTRPASVPPIRQPAAPTPPEQPTRLEALKDLEAGKAKAEVAAVAVSGQASRPEAAPALRQLPAAGLLARSSLAERSSPVPYRLLRADAAGNYAEVEAETVFGQEDQVRVAFEPTENGRLVVASGASRTLLEVNVARGVTTNLDVPPGESRLIVTFTQTGEASATPFAIQIRRE